MGLIDDLTGIANDILGVRDDIGAAIHEVYIVERTWSGTRPGEGTATDVVTQMLPTPGLKDLKQDFKLSQSGRFNVDDLILKNISKQNYADEDTVRLKSASRNVEKFYRVAGEDYVVVGVSESYITWDAIIRRVQ